MRDAAPVEIGAAVRLYPIPALPSAAAWGGARLPGCARIGSYRSCSSR